MHKLLHLGFGMFPGTAEEFVPSEQKAGSVSFRVPMQVVDEIDSRKEGVLFETSYTDFLFSSTNFMEEVGLCKK